MARCQMLSEGVSILFKVPLHGNKPVVCDALSRESSASSLLGM